MKPDFDEYCRESAKSCDAVPDVHPDDFIFKFIIDHPNWTDPKDAVSYYFCDGQSSAHKLRDILSNDLGITPGTPLSLLEFASGYGCVTRHLAKILQNVSIVASDIHPEANEFVRQQIGVNSIQSTPVPEEFPKAFFYDVVFALSFFSHMPKKTWTRWLKVLSDRLNVNGHLIFTTHGLISARNLMPDLQFDEEGFHFHEASEQGDLSKSEYGTTVTTPSFVIRAAELLDNGQVRVFKRGFWWGHQDLWVIQKIPSGLVPLRVQSEDIPDGADTIGHIDTCALITRGGINASRPILHVEGWVAPAPSARSLADEVVIIIDSDDGQRYVAATDPYDRPDVSKAYSNPALLQSGFKTRIDLQGFTFSGTVKAAMRYKNQWVICRLSEKRMVR
jgi:SAM-dependent methyltransferase